MDNPTAFTVNNTWMLVATLLVFIMHLGFACLEAGLCRAKNVVNILFKNVLIVSLGTLTYALVGFALMYPGAEFAGGVLGFAGFGIGTDAAGVTSAYNVGYTYWTDFLFQGMFAATAATIVSGAVAERIKLNSFLAFAAVYVAVVYPIVGFWHWGGGWLGEAGFYDFAGSTIVHGTGGWAALVAVFLLGPRLGKYARDGRIRPMLGHSTPLATIGAFLLWFGWYGFNGGSVLSADPGKVSLVFVTTTLAAAAGVVAAAFASSILGQSRDLTMVLNGALAGLVGVTAGADVFSPTAAIAAGAVAGTLVVASVLFLDRRKLDDPVGAISVHLVCGVWGTLAVGIFSPAHSLATQALGVAAVGAFCVATSALLLFALKASVGIRVSADEERMGLDEAEHGMPAYTGLTGSTFGAGTAMAAVEEAVPPKSAAVPRAEMVRAS